MRITVWRKEELSGEFEIAADSTIAHPLYREVRAVNVPFAELESRIRQRLLSFEANPLFVVAPLIRVSVGGEVRQPGLYTLRPEVTVMQAVARAGGFTERGRVDQVRLVRGGETRSLDLSNPGQAQSQLTVESGDQIYIVRRRDVLRENIAPIASIVAAGASLLRIFLN